MVEVSENKEAAIVCAGSLILAAASYVAALPIPVEIKVPTVTFIGAVSTAILAFWKQKVNTGK